MPNDIQPINNPDELLSYPSFINISNFIVHEACRLYKTISHKKYMPLSFVEFVFSEFETYTFMAIKPIKDFFTIYSNNDLPDIVETYMRNYYSIIESKTNKNSELSYYLKDSEFNEVSLAEKGMFADNDPEIFQNIDNIASHIRANDELLSFRELYEAFMIRKIVVSSTSKTYSKAAARAVASVQPAVSSSISQSNTQNKSADADAMLYGQKIDIPKEKGKVVKLFFPRLTLPSPYPVLQEKSRINSEHRVRHLVSSDREILLLNKHKFNSIKYNRGFIEKRKLASKPQKRKFDFDF